jgi:pilus assembly protein Flp/PilA
MKKIFKLFKNEEGATAIEYGLIAALIAVAAIAAMGAVGGSLTNTFEGVSEKLDNSAQADDAAADPDATT